MSNLRMPSENCSIFNCYSSRTAPGISFFRIPTKNDYKIKLEKQYCYYSFIDGDFKNWTLHNSSLFLLIKIFSIVPIGQKLLELLPTLLLGLVINFVMQVYIKKDWRFFIFSSVIHFNIESANKKPPIISVAFLYGTTLVSDFSSKGVDDKITTML